MRSESRNHKVSLLREFVCSNGFDQQGKYLVKLSGLFAETAAMNRKAVLILQNF